MSKSPFIAPPSSRPNSFIAPPETKPAPYLAPIPAPTTPIKEKEECSYIVLNPIQERGPEGQIGPVGPVGATGPVGPVGPTGAVGPGVAEGGAVGDILVKLSTSEYSTTWTDAPTVDAVSFDLTAAEVSTVGKAYWDADDGTLAVGMAGGNITLKIGQEQLARIKNTTGAALSKGQVVYITGAQGQRLTVGLASNSSEPSSSKTFGVVAEPIADQAEGFIATQGLMRGLNTNAYQEGYPLWLGSTPGTFTTTKPSAPNHLVLVGWVARQASGSAGSIFVHIQNGFELEELHDVRVVSPTPGDLLQRKSSGLWENVPESSITWRESGPAFTYSSGVVTRIDYDSGNYKLFTYGGGVVTRIDYIRGATTIRKDFTYNLDGTLAYITQTEF